MIVPKRKLLLKGALLLLCMILLYTGYELYIRASSADAVWPEYAGTDLRYDGNLVVDCSDLSHGYFLAWTASPTSSRLKLRVMRGEMQFTYDLDNTGEYEVFPLQLGSGDYEISLYQNVGGSKYASGGKIWISASLSDENAAFLVPNQYVDYTKESPSVAKADELGEGASEEEIYQSVCDFMAGEFLYDFVRATTISPGALPEVDECYNNKMGICQDLAAVMVSMLRTQGIPAKLMIGYIGTYYHAWTVSVVNGEERFFDPTAAINAVTGGEYTVERYY